MFLAKLDEIKIRDKTAQLWIQYTEMVAIAKSFIRTEKMENLKGQLIIITEMLPYFYAAGHFNYTKSAYIYAQNMDEFINYAEAETQKDITNALDERNIVELKNFIINGYFNKKRTDKYSSGTFTDTVIEQDLMVMIKGLKDGIIGRGVK